MITDRIEVHSVLLPLLIVKKDKTLKVVISVTVNRRKIFECNLFPLLKNEENTPAVIQRFVVYF